MLLRVEKNQDDGLPWGGEFELYHHMPRPLNLQAPGKIPPPPGRLPATRGCGL